MDGHWVLLSNGIARRRTQQGRNQTTARIAIGKLTGNVDSGYGQSSKECCHGLIDRIDLNCGQSGIWNFPITKQL